MSPGKIHWRKIEMASLWAITFTYRKRKKRFVSLITIFRFSLSPKIRFLFCSGSQFPQRADEIWSIKYFGIQCNGPTAGLKVFRSSGGINAKRWRWSQSSNHCKDTWRCAHSSGYEHQNFGTWPNGVNWIGVVEAKSHIRKYLMKTYLVSVQADFHYKYLLHVFFHTIF